MKFALDLIRWRAKDWWDFVTCTFPHAERAKMTWERFLEMFQAEYVPLVEREREREGDWHMNTCR